MFGWFIGRNKGFQPNTLPNLQLWLDATQINPQGYSLDFDGTDDFVQANNVITAYPFTMECWVRLDVTNVTQRIMAIAETGSTNKRFSLIFSLSTGKFGIQAQNTTEEFNSATTTASANTWYHIAGVFASATSRTLYVNGVAEASGTNSVNFNNSANNRVEMGRHFDNNATPLNGKLSDVRIWNTARTAQQIADNYQRRLNGNESGLVGYWKLDRGTGTTVADSTSNNNTGTITGAIWDNNEPFVEAIDDNTAVRVWQDQSGNAYNAEQSASAARPTYRTNQLNGLPAVVFDGTDDALSLGSSSFSIMRNVSGATIFLIIRYSATANEKIGIFIGNNVGITRLSIGTDPSNFWRVGGRRLDGDPFQSALSSNVSSSNFVIQTGLLNYQNTLNQQYINGALDGQKTDFQTAGNTSDTNSTLILIGNGTGRLTGAIAEIIVYNRALNTSELAQVHRYLSRKWGIALA